MPRTRADAVVSGGKSAKKSTPAPTNSAASSSGANKRKSAEASGGSNPVVVRPTPSWQKPLGEFLKPRPEADSGVDERKDDEKENIDPLLGGEKESQGKNQVSEDGSPPEKKEKVEEAQVAEENEKKTAGEKEKEGEI